IPEDVRRTLADTMSDFRADIGEDMAALLEHRSPEERTWLQGIASAAISSTDYWDGVLTEDLPPSEDGREKDRRGDRNYVMPQQEQMSRNGEVSPAHYRLKVLREGGMKCVRWWGERKGKNLKSLQSGRAKTWAEMMELAAAHSPLSRNEDLMEWGASVGTGLSLNSFAETVFQYMGGDDDENVTDPRNSTARQKSAGIFDRMAGFVDEKAPGFTPSHATKIGKTMVEGSAALLVANPDRAGLATTAYTIFSLLDGFDGSLARKKGVAGVEGMIEDVQADLEQQIATLGALSIVAMRRGNRVAAANYATATMLMPLSAYSRAQAESQGFVVAEGGMGTRIGRGILAGLGMATNKRRDWSDIVSATLATGIANTVLERRDVIVNGEDSNYYVGINRDPGFMEEARIRKDAIRPYAEAGLAIGSLLLAANHSDTVQDMIPKAKPAV
ncbi:MAG TPA: hypothetical protein VFX84_02005, partial [Candidatus Saccharimonadales bacterium]|nr:hypothetical protein [Candidatus Saccharimonadales bacterium]